MCVCRRLAGQARDANGHDLVGMSSTLRRELVDRAVSFLSSDAVRSELQVGGDARAREYLRGLGLTTPEIDAAFFVATRGIVPSSIPATEPSVPGNASGASSMALQAASLASAAPVAMSAARSMSWLGISSSMLQFAALGVALGFAWTAFDIPGRVQRYLEPADEEDDAAAVVAAFSSERSAAANASAIDTTHEPRRPADIDSALLTPPPAAIARDRYGNLQGGGNVASVALEAALDEQRGAFRAAVDGARAADRDNVAAVLELRSLIATLNASVAQATGEARRQQAFLDGSLQAVASDVAALRRDLSVSQPALGTPGMLPRRASAVATPGVLPRASALATPSPIATVGEGQSAAGRIPLQQPPVAATPAAGAFRSLMEHQRGGSSCDASVLGRTEALAFQTPLGCSPDTAPESAALRQSALSVGSAPSSAGSVHGALDWPSAAVSSIGHVGQMGPPRSIPAPFERPMLLQPGASLSDLPQGGTPGALASVVSAAPDRGDGSGTGVLTASAVASEKYVGDKPLAAPSLEESQSAARDCVAALFTSNPPGALEFAAPYVLMVLGNILSHPDVPRYRKLATANESFRKSLVRCACAIVGVGGACWRECELGQPLVTQCVC